MTRSLSRVDRRRQSSFRLSSSREGAERISPASPAVLPAGEGFKLLQLYFFVPKANVLQTECVAVVAGSESYLTLRCLEALSRDAQSRTCDLGSTCVLERWCVSRFHYGQVNSFLLSFGLRF